MIIQDMYLQCLVPYREVLESAGAFHIGDPCCCFGIVDIQEGYEVREKRQERVVVTETQTMKPHLRKKASTLINGSRRAPWLWSVSSTAARDSSSNNMAATIAPRSPYFPDPIRPYDPIL